MEASREAMCHCGQLRVTTTGEPFAVSICHCLACQRRTAIAIWEGCRDMARGDSDFDPVRDDPAFAELIAGGDEDQQAAG